MQDQLRARLDELKREYRIGQSKLHELEVQQTQVRETVLRISGAIQVLEELLAETNQNEAQSTQSSNGIPHDMTPGPMPMMTSIPGTIER